MINSIYIKSKRLYLRPLVINDAKFIFDYAKNIDNTKFLNWNIHKSLKDSENYIKRIIAMYQVCSTSNLGIVINENKTEKLVGTIGLFQHSKRLSNLTYEIGFVLNQKWQGKGLAFEAANSLINYSFTNLNIQRIEATCVLQNIKSLKLLEKLGMHREGLLRQFFYKNDIFYDGYIYSILKRDWNSFK